MANLQHKTIDADYWNELIRLLQRRLISESDLKKIDKNIVDIGRLRTTGYCFEQKDFFPKKDENERVIGRYRDTDVRKHRPELKPIFTKALNSWNYYHGLKDLMAVKRKDADGEAYYVAGKKKKYRSNYKLTDIADIKIIRGENLGQIGLEGKLMIGMVTVDGRKMRYLVNGNIL